jgi:hypothetical protein
VVALEEGIINEFKINQTTAWTCSPRRRLERQLPRLEVPPERPRRRLIGLPTDVDR